MGLFQQINSGAQQRGLRFVVIGGLAVNLHGYSRETADLDLLVCRDARQPWLNFFSELGYSVVCERGAFIQLSPPKQGEWPVDLMMVTAATFEPIREHGKEVSIYGERLLIPTLEHLLALKLHALTHTHAGRFLKDFLDVENLVRVNRMDLKSDKVRALFEKYGSLDLYGKISRAVAGE